MEQERVFAPMWRVGVARSLAHLAEFDRLTKILERNKIKHFFFKGVVLQQKLTGSPLGRDSVDLDLKVSSHEFRRTIRMLLHEGYMLPMGLQVEQLEQELPTELPLIHKKTGVELDIHRHFFAPFYSLSRAEVSLCGLSEERGFSPLGTAFFTLLSGAKDGWPQLGRVLDFHLARERVSDSALRHLCQITGTSRLLELAVELDGHLFSEHAISTRVHPYIQQLRTRPWSRGFRHYYFVTSRESIRDQLSSLATLPTHTSFMDVVTGIQGRPIHRLIRLIRAYGLNESRGAS